MTPGNFPAVPTLRLAVVGVGRVVERFHLAALRRSSDRTLAAAGSVIRRLRGAPGCTLESFGRQLSAWADAVRGGQPPLAADGAAGQRCVELVEACRRSMAVGGAWVPVPEPKDLA